MSKFLPLILGCCFLPSADAAERGADLLDNWHQWRGPLATGESPRGNPPVHWDATTNIKWKAEIPGRGTSTPIVWGQRIFLLTAIDTGREADANDLPKPDARFKKTPKPPTTYHQFVVLCLDRKTGKILWQQIAAERVPHEGHHPTHGYAAFSPTTDGRRLYASFGSQGVFCYDLDGKLIWKRDLGRLNTRLGWGEAVSPVLRGDNLIVNGDQEADSWLAVLDARTG